MGFWKFKKIFKLKRIVSVVLTLGFLVAIPMSSGETALSFLDGEEIYIASQNTSQSQRELNNVRNQLDDLEEQQEAIESELSAKAEELSGLLADKAILEEDMAATEAAIEQAEIDLQIAKEEEEAAYEAMKIRIQYMYENSTQESIWDAILNAKSFTDMLNHVEYVNQVHKSDRELLDEYKAVVVEVEALAAELEASMEEMVALEEIYEHQEAELESIVAELEAEAENYESQIAAAEARAEALAASIAEQNRLMASGGSSSGGSTSSGSVSTAGGYLTDSSYDPAFRTNVSGEELVAYALQFVGYPYKWGGNSLTEGSDCSGFVKLIYNHFGFMDAPRQSQAYKTYGQPVAYENLKAGDIVVYPGHVAIYIGNGCIVEAQSTRAGITCNRAVNCKTITAIRRVL